MLMTVGGTLGQSQCVRTAVLTDGFVLVMVIAVVDESENESGCEFG